MEKNLYLVFDIGGTFVKYGLLSENGTIYEKSKIKTLTDDKSAFLLEIKKIYNNYKDRNLQGIAISMPGILDSQGIIERGGAIRCMYGCNIIDEISSICDGIKVSLENDGNCVGLAEYWLGAARNTKSCVVLVFGTGVASSIILDGKVLRGSHNIAGEASYLVTNPNLNQMEIHRFGTEYSAKGLVEKAKKLLCKESLTGEELFSLYNNNDKIVVPIMEDFFFHIACQCYNIQALIDPEIICIGGGISKQESLITGIQKYCKSIYENTKQFRIPDVTNCQYLDDSNLIGALYHFLCME